MTDWLLEHSFLACFQLLTSPDFALRPAASLYILVLYLDLSYHLCVKIMEPLAPGLASEAGKNRESLSDLGISSTCTMGLHPSSNSTLSILLAT